MSKMLIELMNEVRGSFLNLIGIVAAIGQFAFLGKLFSDDTPTTTIYIVCFALFCVMCFLSIRSFLKARSQSPYSHKRQVYKTLFIVYAILMLLALYPAGNRWRYIHTDWLPSNHKPLEIDPGIIFGGIIGEVRASVLEQPLKITMYLDSMRTSLQCTKTRNSGKDKEESFNVDECAEYSILPNRLQQIMNGHRIDEGDARKEEFDQHYAETFRLAFNALKLLSEYRKKPDPLFEKGPLLMFLVSKDTEWQKKSRGRGLYPTDVSEWEYLTKASPDGALALRKFIIEWIGFLEPIFHISFTNTTSKPIVLSGLKYTANPRRTSIQTTLFGAYDTPRYLVKLQQGAHETEIQPPIEVPANGSKAIDILLRLEKPDPGVPYDLDLEFLSKNPTYSIAVPRFGITFMKSK